MVKLKFDHVGIVVNDVEKTAKFFVENLGCWRGQTYDVKTWFETHQFKYTWLKIGEDYVEILEPKKGLFLKILEEKGEGSVAEICFEVDDLGKFYDEMKSKDIILTDMDEKPLVDEKYISSPTGNKFAYLPRAVTSGVWVELMERGWH